MIKESFSSLEKNILYQDNHLIIINKLPSTIVQSDKSGDDPISEELKRYLKKKFNKPGNVYLGIVHRIDRPVSGIVIFTKTEKALVRLNEMLKERAIKKSYWAIVKNKPPKESDHLIHHLYRNRNKNKVYAHTSEKTGTQKAELTYKIIDKSDHYYLLEIELITGRHHQIRAQLSAIGCPIKGDIKYGSQRTNKTSCIHLHARKIQFMHPVKKEEIVIVAEPPDDPLWNYFKEKHR